MTDARKHASQAWTEYKAEFNQQLLLSDHSGDLLQSRSSCYFDFPDPLEFQDDGYTNVHLHIYEGCIQFGVIAGSAFCCFQFQHIEPLRSFIPADFPLQFIRALLLLNLAWRVVRLLCVDFEHIYRFKDLRWRTTRSLIIFGAMLASPSLFYPPFKLIYDHFDLDHIPSWFIQNSAYIQMMAISMQFGSFDGLSFREAWSLDKSRQSNSTSSNTKWDLVKESVVAAVSRTLVRDPTLLWILATAVIVALYRFAILVVASMRPRISSTLKVLLKVEECAVRHRDNFVASLLKLLYIVCGPLRAFGFQRCASALIQRLTTLAQMLALAVFSTTRLISIFVFYYPFKLLRLVPFSYLWIRDRPVAAHDWSQIQRIRLLEVEPSLFGDEEVCSRLSWYSLHSPPSYTAISYVWGSSECTSSILLNGKTYKTTASAKQALMKLRSRWRSKRFWIDAICIDQSDIEDRAEQLSGMAEIYRRATEVTVWLGDDKDARFALALAHRLLAGTRPLWFSTGALDHTDCVPDRAWRALWRLLRNPWFERSWVVQEVLHNNVTIQYGDFTILWWEFSMFAMAISKEDGVCTKLDNIGRESHDVDTSSLTSRTSRECISYIRVFQDFQSIHRGQTNQRHLSLLFYLIRMFRSDCKFKATEMKDRVYSLVNLCDLANHPQLRPDFKLAKSSTLTPCELFIVVAKHLLSSSPRERQLDLLFHAGIGNSDRATEAKLQVPSWVPDWSLEEYPCLPLIGQDGTSELLQHPMMEAVLKSVVDLKMFGITNGKHMHHNTPQREKVLSELEHAVRRVRERSFYRSSGTTLPLFKLVDDPANTLELEGKRLDYIKTLGPTLPCVSIDADSSWSTWESQLRPLAAVLLKWAVLIRSSPRQLLLLQILIGELSHPNCDFIMLESNPPTRELSADKIIEVAYYVRLLSFLHRQTPDWSLEEFFDKATYLEHLYPTKELRIKGMLAIHKHVQKVCAGRRFGLTERGFAGLFPQGTRARADSQTKPRADANPKSTDHTGGHKPKIEKGDQVCLFFGADTPFVVRKVPRPSQPGEQQQSLPGHESESKIELKHDYHQLVGPAYLQDFMDGEGLSNAFPTTTFRLR